MKVKKFICPRCKAPKVTKILESYVVCDYCASLVDVDITIGEKEFDAESEKAQRYKIQENYTLYHAEEAYDNDDWDGYYNARYQYWKTYLETFPSYILPTISPDKLEQWIRVSAHSDAYFRFKKGADSEIQEQTDANASIQWFVKDGSNYAEWNSFMHSVKIYHKGLMGTLKEMREIKGLELIQEVFPLDIAIKKEMSSFVQMWLPYLEKDKQEMLLDFTGLKTEYIDLPPINMDDKPCTNCNHTLKVPEGAVRSRCTECNTEHTWQKVLCVSCGGKNDLPKDWKETISCEYCTSEIRVINKIYE